jgi:hypothetical protein
MAGNLPVCQQPVNHRHFAKRKSGSPTTGPPESIKASIEPEGLTFSTLAGTF